MGIDSLLVGFPIFRPVMLVFKGVEFPIKKQLSKTPCDFCLTATLIGDDWSIFGNPMLTQLFCGLFCRGNGRTPFFFLRIFFLTKKQKRRETHRIYGAVTRNGGFVWSCRFCGEVFVVSSSATPLESSTPRFASRAYELQYGLQQLRTGWTAWSTGGSKPLRTSDCLPAK